MVPGNSSVTEHTSGDTDCVGSSSKPCLYLNSSCGTCEQQQAASAVKSEGGSCQDPLRANSQAFSHASCPSKSIQQLSTKYQQDFRCKHVASKKGLWAHAISSTSFPFLFSNPFCTVCRIVSLILVSFVGFENPFQLLL